MPCFLLYSKYKDKNFELKNGFSQLFDKKSDGIKFYVINENFLWARYRRLQKKCGLFENVMPTLHIYFIQVGQNNKFSSKSNCLLVKPALRFSKTYPLGIYPSYNW